jgi:hypothetical protein
LLSEENRFQSSLLYNIFSLFKIMYCIHLC